MSGAGRRLEKCVDVRLAVALWSRRMSYDTRASRRRAYPCMKKNPVVPAFLLPESGWNGHLV